jgi:rhodanese-related sulfurtransferase
MTFIQMVAEAKANIEEVSVHEFQNQAHASYTLIDVREPAEYNSGHAVGAVNIPRGVIEMELSSNPEFQNLDKEMVLMCKSGGRSALAAVSVAKLGYSNVKSMAGGFQQWDAEGLPTI